MTLSEKSPARRLLDYVKFNTASVETAETCPSSAEQKTLADYLAAELRSVGVENAFADEHGYVYGKIPGNVPIAPAIGFIAHMDVSPDAPSENIKTVITENYGGGVILRPYGNLDPKDVPELGNYVGKTVICSDGATLLGADDKAGVAEIVTMCQKLNENPELPHGDVCVAFTPDEEIGRGTDYFDISGFGADFAYTMDGSAFGELETETFNAAAARVSVTGVSIHPGSAKDRMINAITAAAEFQSGIPADERPETTEGRQGFYHPVSFTGSVESVELDYILRDHDRNKLEARKVFLQELANELNCRYGRTVFTVTVKDQYRNMSEVLERFPQAAELARSAFEEMGVVPVSNPVRGGTDGAWLSFRGLPCPNLGTGCHCFHGRKEFAVAEEMDRTVELMLRIVRAQRD